MVVPALMWAMTLPLSAQNIFQRLDSVLTENYRSVKYDTAYIVRPQTKWTVIARLNVSGMGQRATLDWEDGQKLKMTNIGIGAGYGYNFVPHQGWLLHISALPTFIVYNNASMTLGDSQMDLKYHFPEVIITGRGAVVRQWGNKFLALTMVYNFTNIGDKNDFSIYNTKWRIRTVFGVRI